MEERVLLGNEAIGLALIEAGVHFVASYPGTPSSEILPAAVRFREEFSADTYIEWSVNEKVAYDNALAASYTGKFAAVIMKQVGLNVASDSLLSSAYTGTVGALLVISCDDPGPHSSQTEQDSRFFAMFAKVPALDPTSPKDAMDLVHYGLELSHRHQIPVILRPAVRVSHARQNVPVSGWKRRDVEALFERDPGRWAATPRYRFILHKKLNAKLKRIEEEFEGVHLNAATFLPEGGKAKLGIIAAGVPYATVYEILDGERLLDEVPLMRIATPFPAPLRTVQDFIGRCEKVLVVEETDAVVELQIPNRTSVLGRLDGTVPNEGELLPEVVYDVLRRALETAGSKRLRARDVRLQEAVEELSLPVRRPTLCPGCPHRASFFAIKKAIPKGIYTSDIGCYTLGLNLGAVDTCLDMGGAITIATGLSQAFAADAKEQPIVATIGDSTFYHAGMPGLLNAVYNRAKIVLVVLDNGTTAMTGMQPTPGTGVRADGSEGGRVPLETAIRGCGVEWLEVVDPFDVPKMVEVLKAAHKRAEKTGKVSVVIARHPCILASREARAALNSPVVVTEKCNGCGFCIENFECPALVMDEDAERVRVDENLCVKCGVCIHACPRKAISLKKEKGL